MDKKVLERAVTKTVEYYFEGLSFKDAINKVLEEMGEKRMFGVHDKTIWNYCEIKGIWIWKDFLVWCQVQKLR